MKFIPSIKLKHNIYILEAESSVLVNKAYNSESLKEKQNLRAYTKIYEYLSGVTLYGFRDWRGAATLHYRNRTSLRKQPLLFAPRRWRRFARNVSSGEERV